MERSNIEIAADYQNLRMRTMYKLQLAISRSKQRTLNRRQTLRLLAFKKNSLNLKRYADRMSQIQMVMPKLIRKFGNSGSDLIEVLKSMGWEDSNGK